MTLIDAEPVLPVASRAPAVSVCAPLGVSRESQSSVIGMLLDVCVFTTVPPADSVTVDAPLAPLTQIVTHTTPLTVDPAPGLVMATFSVPPVGGGGGGGGGDVVFCTVTVIVAVAVRPAASLALSASVWLPLARALVFQANEAVVPVTVWVEARVPSMVRRNVFEAPEAPPTSMPTVTVPLTVAPLAGLMKRAVSGGGGVVPFATVTLSDAEPVLPAASRALTVRVLIPSGVRREFQSSVIGMLLDVWLFTTVPETLRVTVDGAVAPSTHTVTQTTPLTVAPALGVVIATRSAEAPLETVTVMLDVAVRPPESVTVAARVWVPAATPDVFQANDGVEPVNAVAPSTASR